MVQFIAESTLKLILGVPVVGGIFLVVLLLDANVEELLRGDVREILAAVFSALRANPAALTSFAIAFLLVLIGGSLLTFIVKGGTVAVLVEADEHAGAIERPPLRLQMLRRRTAPGSIHFSTAAGAWGGGTSSWGWACWSSMRSRPPRTSGCSSAATRWPTTSACCLWWTVIAAAGVERRHRLDHARELSLSRSRRS